MTGNRRVGPGKHPAESPPPADARPATSEPRRSARVPAQWITALRGLAGLVLVTGTSTGVAYSARQYVISSRRFAVASIEVTGNERRPAATLIAESGLAVGNNIFAADLDGARERLLADENLLDATLVRRLPGTLSIHVVERKVGGLVALGDTFLATSDGEPFKIIGPDDPVDLPIVTGLRPEDIGEDREGATRTIQRAFELAAEYDRTDLSKRAPLQEVHVGQGGALTLVVGHSAVRLVFGAPPFRRKLDQAARIVAELDRRGARPDAIMLDNDARPERVVVRMR